MADYNSNEYGWNDVTISVNGNVMFMGTGVSFSDEISAELIYGKGDEPRGINDGNRKYEGTLKAHQSELDRLLISTGNKGVKGLKKLTVVFSMEKEGRISTRTLKNCRITKIGEDYKQGDAFAEIELPFIFTGIEYA